MCGSEADTIQHRVFDCVGVEMMRKESLMPETRKEIEERRKQSLTVKTGVVLHSRVLQPLEEAVTARTTVASILKKKVRYNNGQPPADKSAIALWTRAGTVAERQAHVKRRRSANRLKDRVRRMKMGFPAST